MTLTCQHQYCWCCRQQYTGRSCSCLHLDSAAPECHTEMIRILDSGSKCSDQSLNSRPSALPLHLPHPRRADSPDSEGGSRLAPHPRLPLRDLGKSWSRLSEGPFALPTDFVPVEVQHLSVRQLRLRRDPPEHTTINWTEISGPITDLNSEP